MVRSMTGYGRGEAEADNRKITVEIKSVNNRYLDFNIRLPRKFNFLEARIRAALKEYVIRGKVDVFITFEEFGDEAGSLKYNETLASEYVSYMQSMVRTFNLSGGITVSDLVRAPEVFTLSESEKDEEEIWSLLEKALHDAAAAYNEARTAEGERLKADILLKLEELLKETEDVIAHEPEIMEAYQARLMENMEKLLADHSIDESRIIAECALFADKISTDEESVRLKSHIVQMRDVLSQEGSIGKRMDFLAQEMNREANTTLSKAGDLITADHGIAMKTVIEKIREQIQNIE